MTCIACTLPGATPSIPQECIFMQGPWKLWTRTRMHSAIDTILDGIEHDDWTVFIPSWRYFPWRIPQRECFRHDCLFGFSWFVYVTKVVSTFNFQIADENERSWLGHIFYSHEVLCLYLLAFVGPGYCLRCRYLGGNSMSGVIPENYFVEKTALVAL